ncbi:hypothetical protein IHC87_21235 (plasmid) [Photobacterium damselae subsp. damselae]|uniref:hypothetical protein n=1 Tax=Photobacterium damselae TaxID=38293 RepID=UPI001F1B05E2|nr:hypothetical protein [Photobacterium damselae]UJZ96600.1 hypothetical protein IHC87_21235 [Photobacterium damselae subsp. damselae]UKA00524.1 hypothetical protein IHC88_21330 [Photobacterium damselae subsp. damselae]
MLRYITIALGSGFIGGVANVFAIYLINPLQNLSQPDHIFIYKQVFWGGLWALLYCLPFLKQRWFIRGIIIGFIASLCTFFAFQTIPVTSINIIKAFMVNLVIWGGCSSFFFYKATMSESSL